MSELIKSVLLLDYDSLYRSLAGAGGEVAARLATRVPGWIAGIEAGELIGPRPTERAIMVKRCYADPSLLGQNIDHFTAAAFSIVECPASVAGTRQADINIAIDAIEAIADPVAYDEFIVLSAEPALSPLLARLKARGRRTAIYADKTTAPAHRALADGALDVTTFAEFLLTHDADEAASAAALDRAEIEAFARKIHAATNIPLFSPKAFAEMFRFLTAEIAANGYHFQTTAKNVADRLMETGRSVTRRQVVFIVKGLALKGHVFSTSDTPRKLAEVFREQASYLIGNAGLTLDEDQERLLNAWLVDRVPVNAAPPAARVQPAAPPMPRPEIKAPVEIAKPAQPEETVVAVVPVEPAVNEPATPAERKPAEQRPVAQSPKPTAEVRPPAKAPVEKPVTPATKPAPAKRTPPPQRPQESKTGKAMISPDDARAAIAARVAASVQSKTGGPRPNRPAVRPPAAHRPATPRTDLATPAPESAQTRSIESSILAAIAEAVDVLVEDGTTTKSDSLQMATKKQSASESPARPRPAAMPEPEPGEGSGDIGDEIQRIIATYNRTRKETPRT